MTLKNFQNFDQLSCHDPQIRISQLSVNGGTFASLVVGSDFSSVDWLTLAECQNLTSIDNVADFQTSKVMVSKCDAIEKIELRCDDQLKVLHVSQCVGLKSIDAKFMRSIRQLNIDLWPKLEVVNGLNSLKHLQQIRMFANDVLSQVGPLIGLSSLEEVDVSFCDQLKELALTDCGAIESVADITNGCSFENVTFENCDSISELECYYTPKSLNELTIRGPHRIPQDQLDRFKRLQPQAKLSLERP